MATDFDRKEYWHGRFATEHSFEWLLPAASFMSILEPYLERLPSTARILHLGMGTSSLQNDLRARGFLDVTNIDYEPLAVDRGRQLEQDAFGDVRMRYVVADATRLGEEDVVGLLDDGGGQFDLVVDKSTADAVSCGGDEAILRMAEGVKGCLSSTRGGVWISLSYSSSRFSARPVGLDVEVVARIPTPKLKATDPDIYHWCYLLRPTGATGPS